MATWWSRARALVGTEIIEIRKRNVDLEPADLTQFTLPLMFRLVGVLFVGSVPLLIVRNSHEVDKVTVAFLGAAALTAICAAVVTWVLTIALSGLVLVTVYWTPPKTASRLVVRTVMDAFRRISDVTTLLVSLVLVAGLVAFAFGLPTRRDNEAAHSMIDDLLAAQLGVLFVAMAIAYLVESVRCAAELIDKQSLLLTWPWALGITCLSWVVATAVPPFRSTRLLTKLLIDWLPGSVDGIPQERVIADLLPVWASWTASLLPLPVIVVIWVIEAQRFHAFKHLRRFLDARDGAQAVLGALPPVRINEPPPRHRNRPDRADAPESGDG